MPTYYSVKRGQTLELRRGFYSEINDPDLGNLGRQAVKPLKVKFIPLDPPFPVFGMPSKHGLAEGILTPEEAAAQIRRSAGELGGSPDRLPKTDEALAEWVVQRLRKHLGNGSLFVEIADADEVVPGEVMDENLGVPRPGMVTTPVGVIVRSEDGKRAYCKVCDRSLKPQGINGHSRSNDHLAKLALYEDEMKAQAERAH